MTWNNESVTNTNDDEGDAPAPLKFERRSSDRWPSSLVGTAFELGGNSFGHMHSIKVLDYSDGGLGAMSDTPLTPGSMISIGFASPGMYAKRGTVLRCVPCGDGYRLSVQFEARMAA